MTVHQGALTIPPAAAADTGAAEIARIWVAGSGQHVTLRADVWEDPAAWGLLLADVARHAANAYAQAEGRDVGETLARIRLGWEAEWDSPTDEPTGALTD